MAVYSKQINHTQLKYQRKYCKVNIVARGVHLSIIEFFLVSLHNNVSLRETKQS